MQSFKDLIVWQKSMDLVSGVYLLTRTFPREELYGLTSQMRRSAISIPSNIAEGKKRRTRKDFLQFLRIADGSAAELETQLLLAERLSYGRNSNLCALLCEIQKMLSVIIKKLEV